MYDETRLPTRDTAADLHALRAFPDAEGALVRALRTPIDALRASLEALARDLAADAGRLEVLHGASEELHRLRRNVEELVELASPAEPRPLRCTPAEIAYSAREQLPAEERERLVVARASELAPIHVDGPALARAVRRVAENALEASADVVLLSVRQDAGHVVFSVVDHAPGSRFDPGAPLGPFRSQKRGHLGLGLALARRDVERMGGALEGQRGEGGDTWFRIRIPSPAEEGSAEQGELAA